MTAVTRTPSHRTTPTPPKTQIGYSPEVDKTLAVAGAVLVGGMIGEAVSRWLFKKPAPRLALDGAPRAQTAPATATTGEPVTATPEAPKAAGSNGKKVWDWLGGAAVAGLSYLQREAALVNMTPELQSATEAFSDVLFTTQALAQNASASMEQQAQQLMQNTELSDEQRQGQLEQLQQMWGPLAPLMDALPQVQSFFEHVAPGQTPQAKEEGQSYNSWPAQIDGLLASMSAVAAALPESDANKAEALQAIEAVQSARAAFPSAEELEQQQTQEVLRQFLTQRLLGMPFNPEQMELPEGYGPEQLEGAYSDWLSAIHHADASGSLSTLKAVKDELRKDFIVVASVLDTEGGQPFLDAFSALGGKPEDAVIAHDANGEMESLDGKSTYAERLDRVVGALEKLDSTTSAAATKKKIAAALEPLKAVQQELIAYRDASTATDAQSQ